MMEKIKSEKMTSASKPVPMKLFAAWEVDRTPSNCIPRLCTLRITNLRVCGPLGDAGCPNTGAVILAARMHSSKRTLRSNDIIIPPSDVELDLCFSLQYPHFVKRDGNRLQIMLQRRKKYKNRTILGCKTLAEGVIRMDQVLQRSMDMELELIGVGGKGGCAAGQPVARITITGLASTPVDHDTKNNNTMVITERGYSDEEEEGEFSSVEEAEDMTYGAPARRRAHRQLAFNKGDMSYTKCYVQRSVSLRTQQFNREMRNRDSLLQHKANDSDSDNDSAPIKIKASQRNLKQKFAALLRRFRVPEDMGERDATRDHARNTQRDIDELFQELESLSCGEGEDSGPDQMDTISIVSTPKPSLRPFFTSSRCLANQDMHRHSNVACQASLAYYNELPPVKEKVTNVVLSESEVLRSSAGDERGSEGNSDGDVTAEALASGASVSSSPPKDVKEDKRSRLFRSSTSGGNLTPSSAGRKKASLVIATNRPLSAHELPAQSPTSIEPRRSAVEQVLVVVGEEGPLPEVVALSNGHGCGQLAMQALHVPTLICDRDVKPMLTALYARLHTQASRRCDTRIVLCGDSVFCSNVLRAHTELSARHVPDKQCSTFLIVPIGPNVIARHLAASDPVYAALFLTESWNTLSERGTDSTVSEIQQMASRIQRYINSNTPVNLVPIGEAMVAYRELCGEEDVNNSFVPFLSEVRVGLNEGEEEGSPGRVSPPTVSANPHEHEPIELQLDYWLVPKSPTEESKVTIKAAFRSLHVTRQNGNLSITYITKEKKQKIMRLGKKKEKPGEAEVGRTQSVAGVTRLICSAKGSHNAPLKVYIDGTEWNGVKFFKLSRQWQTHVKTFPVATLSEPQVTDN